MISAMNDDIQRKEINQYKQHIFELKELQKP